MVVQMAHIFQQSPLTLFQLIDNDLRQLKGKAIKKLKTNRQIVPEAVRVSLK